MNLIIKAASFHDLSKIAHCHCVAFPTSLASALGEDYVRFMTGWYISTSNTFLFFAEEEGRCIGYCGGMMKTIWGIGSASSMAQYSFNAAVKAFMKRPWLLFHREIRKKYQFILKNLFSKIFRKKNEGDTTVVFEPYVGLVVIGVDPAYQGRGYGSALLQEFEKITHQKGLKKMILTVKSDNVGAIKSYIKNGWVITNTKKQSLTMEKKWV
jgi:ribosomal protein S18 acetylase RimI-like enzyme